MLTSTRLLANEYHSSLSALQVIKQFIASLFYLFFTDNRELHIYGVISLIKISTQKCKLNYSCNQTNTAKYVFENLIKRSEHHYDFVFKKLDPEKYTHANTLRRGDEYSPFKHRLEYKFVKVKFLAHMVSP